MMRYKKVVLSIFFTVFILVALLLAVYYLRFRQGALGAHASGVSLQLLLATKNPVKKGEEFNVNVYIDTGGLKVTGADIRLRYDPTVLVAESITPAGFLPVMLSSQKLSAGATYMVLGSNPTAPVSGTGILETVKFKALDQGKTASILLAPASAISAIGQTTDVLTGTTAALNIVISAK